MKIAVQLGLLPGNNATDKAKWAQDNGVEGIELGVWGGGLSAMRRDADAIGGLVPISSVCGNADVDGNTSFDFLDPDLNKRRKSIEGSKAILQFCGEVGAAGQIVPPIFGGPKVPDLAPVMSPLELEDKLMVAACQEIGPHAAAHNTLFMLEPLNRYEQHYLRKQSDGVRIIKASGVKGVGLLSDLFHMHIEETDSPAALVQAGKHVTHIHLADNTRMEPGTGDIDFVAAFKALKKIGFKGYMAYECGITGDTPKKKAANLAKSLQFVRDCIEQAN
ncbi:MAG: sugar phosphate isomerase/epimerase [Abitibacteriaceae bacterium]|nr:sugar phosphate isomerase/epimerase [Abditibacteriaceae bacterium]MBV9868447.1 sugar phosphate isomerase/epimerase [Abditibacteriaceae bacterium]